MSDSQPSPAPPPSAPARAVLMMRIAVYGTVALLALGVYALKASRAASSDRGSERVDTLAGPTESGGRIRMLARFRQVQFVEAQLRTRCQDGRPGWRSTVRLSGGRGVPFRYDGRAFDASTTGSQKDGESRWAYAVRVRGELSEDGRSVAGRAQLEQVRIRDGRVADLCRSGDVRFRASAGMPDGDF